MIRDLLRLLQSTRDRMCESGVRTCGHCSPAVKHWARVRADAADTITWKESYARALAAAGGVSAADATAQVLAERDERRERLAAEDEARRLAASDLDQRGA